MMRRITNASSIRRWSQSAEFCYKRGCICKDCPIYEQFFKNKKGLLKICHMKAAVLELVKQFGIPKRLQKTEDEVTI